MEEAESGMKVRVGWSGENDKGVWFKHDVELEEDDWIAYSQEHGFDFDGFNALVSPQMKFAFLENEATLLMSAWVTRHVDLYAEAAMESVEQCKARRTALLEKIHSQQGAA